MIRRLVADGVPQRQVAPDLGVGRSTVERALASGRPPKYERPTVAASFTPFEPLVRQLLKDTPDMPATVIAERDGWTGSLFVSLVCGTERVSDSAFEGGEGVPR